MRVTNQMIASTFIRNLSRTLGRLYRYQEQVATGRGINRPSDDPLGTLTCSNLKSKIQANERFMENIDDALGWLGYTEDTLNSIQSVLTRAKELAVQGGSDTLSPTQREALGEEVDQLLEHLLSLSNSRFAGKYIFGGTRTRTSPYQAQRDEDGRIVSIESTGDTSGTIQREVGPGVRVRVNIRGKDLFEGASGIFNALIELRDGLRSGDASAVRDAMDGIEEAVERVGVFLGWIGAKVNRLQEAKDRLQADNLNLSDVLSSIEDAEVVEAIVNLQREQTAYQAALAVGEQLLKIIQFWK